jgi:multiple sugar transport system substrate-binding protein
MKAFRFSALLALVILALLVAACGSPGGEATPAGGTGAQATTAAQPTMAATTAAEPTMAATTAAEPTAAATAGASGAMPGEMEVMEVEDGASLVFSGWGEPSEQQVYRDSIARFNEVYPDVAVDFQPIPADFQTKIKAMMAGGTAPDVMYVDDQLMTAFAPSGQLLALDEYMNEAGVSVDDFIPALMTPFTYEGQTYALPKDWGTLGLVYLPEAFADAGIDEPTADWTWDDLQTAAQAIADKGTFAGFCMNADWARFAPFAFGAGGAYASEDFTEATVNTPEILEAAQFVAGMKESGALVTAAEVGAGWCGEAIGKKLVAMTYEGGWMVNTMRLDFSDVEWAAVPLPAGPEGQASVIFTNGIGVNAATEFPRAAAALAMYLTGADNQGEIVKTGFAYSTHPEQVELVQDENDKAIATAGTWEMTRVGYWGPNTGKVNDAISKALERIYLGDQTVEESFEQAQTEVQAALDGE